MARESMRADQIDAHVLDEEYRQLALSQLESTIEGLPVAVSRALGIVRPEIELALDTVLWSSCISQGATPGQVEEDISYKDYTPNRVATHFGLSVLLPYLTRRIPELWQKPNWIKAVSKIEAVYEIFAILHYLRFLRRGGHSTLVEQVLGLRNWSNSLPTIGTINYESQNRELLWHAFRDALLLGWPFFTIAQRYWKKKVQNSSIQTGMLCAACGKTATIPVKWSCSHVACYWCDTSRKETGCIACGSPGRGQIVRGKEIGIKKE